MSRHPWRDTSNDIAGQSTSQWETPAGAQEKADKAEQSANDYSNKKLNSHIGTGGNAHALSVPNGADGFISGVDQAKLDGITEGAEPNQYAFSIVNNINALNQTDSLIIEGGVGIDVSNNPLSKRIRITAKGDAIPGLHGTEHTEFGADPIPNATDTEGGLMSAVDKVKLSEVIMGLADIGGVGRTIETVKGNSDAIADVTTQLSDIAYSAKSNGLKGDGVTNDYAALNALITTIGPSRAQVFLGKGDYVIGTSITIPSNIKLIFSHGAMLAPSIGVTITINGPVDAGIYQIFSGNGTIMGSPKVDSVYPQWFGAVADASTDCSIGFQKALDFAGGITVRVPCGESSYVFNNHITMKTNNTLIGEGRNAFIYCRSKYSIKIAGNNCTVDGFVVNMGEAPSGGSAILIDTSTQVISNTRIGNIRFFACYNAISDSQTGKFANDLIIERCYTLLDKGEQITLWYTQGFITLREVVVDRTSNSYPVTWNGISIHNFGGLELEKVDVLGPTSILTTPVYQSGYGIYIKGDPALSPTIWLTRVLVDNIMQDGIYIENVKNIVCNNVMVYQAFGDGLRLNKVQMGQFLNTFIVGAKGITGAPVSQMGIVMQSCSNLEFSGVFINDNNSHGLYMDTVTDCNFNNVQIKNNGGWGKIDAQLCDRNITTNARVSGNTSGSVLQLGSASAFCNWIADAGAFRSSDVGSFSQ